MQSMIELDQTFRKHIQRKQYKQKMVQEYGMCKPKHLTQNVYKHTKHLHILLKTARNADCHPYIFHLLLAHGGACSCLKFTGVTSLLYYQHFCAIGQQTGEIASLGRNDLDDLAPSGINIFKRAWHIQSFVGSCRCTRLHGMTQEVIDD